MIEDKEDFFEDIPEEKPKKEPKPKAPRYKRDDARYYEQPEDPWEHLKPSPYRRAPILWITGACVIVMAILIGLYIYIFTPRVHQAVQYGYVDHIQKEGTMFHSFEGVILPYKSLMDTVRPYEGDFVFSTKDDKLAAELLRRQDQGEPVRVEYKVYRVLLPWRGKSKVIITAVDSLPNPSVLLPPDRRPEYIISQ